jgi:hypothetical protein
MATNDCTIVIDESALSALYRWLLSLADDEDQAQAEQVQTELEAEGVTDDND